MNSTPPPLPPSQPPVIQGKNTNPYPSFYRFSKAWFAMAMLTGIAAGRAYELCRDFRTFDGGMAVLVCGFLIFAGLGLAGISYSILHLIKRPNLETFLGMKRFFWLGGMPLAWACGGAMGLLWRYI